MYVWPEGTLQVEWRPIAGLSELSSCQTDSIFGEKDPLSNRRENGGFTSDFGPASEVPALYNIEERLDKESV